MPLRCFRTKKVTKGGRRLRRRPPCGVLEGPEHVLAARENALLADILGGPQDISWTFWAAPGTLL